MHVNLSVSLCLLLRMLIVLSTGMQQTLQPHPELWFEDGNVVLIAESTSFRVHKSILSRTSDFFKDMFSLPQPPLAEVDDDKNDLTSPCPTIPTSETAEDLMYFLDAMYNSLKYVSSYSMDMRKDHDRLSSLLISLT